MAGFSPYQNMSRLPAPDEFAMPVGPGPDSMAQAQGAINQMNQQAQAGINPMAFPPRKPIARTTTRTLNPAPPINKLDQELSDIEKSQWVQNQKQGIDQLQNLMDMGLEQPQATDISPLLALSDSLTGSKLVQAYQRPETAQEKIQKAAAYAAKIQDDRNQLSQRVLEAYGKNKQGQGSTTMVIGGGGPMDIRGGNQVSEAYEKHLKPFNQMSNSIDRVESALSTPVITKQQLAEANEAILQALTAGRKAGLAELTRSEFDSLPARLAANLQNFTGKPQDIGSREIIQHMRDIMGRIKSIAGQQALKQVDALDSGYSAYPESVARSVSEGKSKYYREKFLPSALSHDTPAAGAPKVGEMIDGHKFKGGDPANPASWEKVN